MRPARIYIRRSDDDQSGYSPQAQERECRAYCVAEQLQVMGVYIDDDVSGTRRSRPALNRLLADVRPGEIIVVHHYDRLSRDTAFTLDLFFKQLQPRDIKIKSVQGGFDPYSDIGKLLLTVQGGVSEYFIDNLRREIKKGFREKVQQGGWVGLLPHGYSSEWTYDSSGMRVRGSGRAVPNEDAPVVRELFERYASGIESTRTLAADLNKRGLTARGRHGRVRWSADRVSAILSNPFYIGIVRYHDQELPGAHEPLIDQSTWEQVAAIRNRRNQGGGNTFGVRQLGLLSELGRCERCGEPLHWIRMSEQRNRYYVCRGRRKNGLCDAPSMRAEVIDEQVLSWLRSLMVPRDLYSDILACVEQELAQEQSAPVIDQRAVEQQIRRLDRLYEVGAKSDAEWETERAALLNQLSVTPAPSQHPVDFAQALFFLEELGTLIDASGPEYQHALLGTVIRNAWCAQGRLIAVRPAPAYGLLIQAVRAVRYTGVISTGLKVGFSAFLRSTPLWDAFDAEMQYDYHH